MNTLIDEEVRMLTSEFPELSWMGAKDWQAVATYADWCGWLDAWSWAHDQPREGLLARLLRLRKHRVAIRKDCRGYFGAENVPNINDPWNKSWAPAPDHSKRRPKEATCGV